MLKKHISRTFKKLYIEEKENTFKELQKKKSDEGKNGLFLRKTAESKLSSVLREFITILFFKRKRKILIRADERFVRLKYRFSAYRLRSKCT